MRDRRAADSLAEGLADQMMADILGSENIVTSVGGHSILL